MKYLIISLFLFFWGHLTLSSQPCYIGTEEYNNIALEQKDSVLCKRSFLNNVEKIYVVHKEEVCLINLKHVAAWEVSGYFLRQKSIFEQMKYNIIKQIPIQTLNKSFEHKGAPIMLNLTIAPHDGVVKKVFFYIHRDISSDLTNEDILKFENIILNTKFTPEPSMDGDILMVTFTIGHKKIEEFLDSNR